MKYLVGLVTLLMFGGCMEKQPADVLVPYYDLSTQLRKHILMLYHEKAYLIKYVTYNGKSDQVINRKPDWNKEFDPFFEVDLHAPAFVGLYTSDTMINSDSTRNIIYKAKSDDESVRELTIHVSTNGDLLSFYALVENGSMLNRSIRKMSYERYRSFEVSVEENNKYSGDDAYRVKGEIHLDDEYFQ